MGHMRIVAEVLPTRRHRSRYQKIDPLYVECSSGIKTIAHILMRCLPHQDRDEELGSRTGFTGELHGGKRRDPNVHVGRRTLEASRKKKPEGPAEITRPCIRVTCYFVYNHQRE